MNEYIQISHKDLDGVVCCIITKTCFGDRLTKIYDIAYQNAHSTFRKALNRMERHPNLRLIVTDIASDRGLKHFNAETGKDISKFMDRIWWIDHHPNNEVAQSMTHKIYEVGRSASMLTYEVFSKKYDLSHLRRLVVFADDYDMWHLEYRTGWALSDLYYWMWTEKFMKRFGAGNLKFTQDEKEYLLKLEVRRKAAWKKIRKEVMVNENEFGKFFVFLTTRKDDVNFLCEKLKRVNEDGCEFIIAVTGEKTVSLRAINQDLNLPEMFKDYGVGGHPHAAGAVIDLNDNDHVFVKKFFRGA